MLLLKKSLLFLLSLASLAQQSPHPRGRILFYAPLITKSIRIKAMPLIRGLADEGHHMALLMPFCQDCHEHENITVLDTTKYYDHFSSCTRKVYLNPSLTLSQCFKAYCSLLDAILKINDLAMGHPELKNELDRGFDIIISYNTIGGPEIMGNYLAHRTNASLVFYSTDQGPTSKISHFVGQPYHSGYMSQPGFFSPDQQTFFDRVANTVVMLFLEAISNYYIGIQEKLLDKHFPGEFQKPLSEISKEVSLVLYTGHPILDGVRPTMPNFQYIGFMHCRPAKPLTSDFKRFMERSLKNGVILVSFGTIDQGNSMPETTRKMMIKVFSKLEQNIIWKWGGKDMNDLPENVMLSKWVPQQDILGHPATKLFISHVGQSSVQESLYHGKPMVAVPLIYDQRYYGHKVESLGVGLSIEYRKLTKEKLYNATFEVLKNPIYSKNARKFSKIFKEDVWSPTDKAIQWVQYVMRNKENLLRSPVHNLAWYQYYLIDVILFLAIVIVLLGYIVLIPCRKLWQLAVHGSEIFVEEMLKRKKKQE